MKVGRLKPRIPIKGHVGIGVMPVFLFRRRVHDTGDMPGFRNHKCHVIRSGHLHAVITITPRRDVIGLTGHGKHRQINIRDLQGFAKQGQPVAGEPVSLAQFAQILHSHTPRKVGSVAIPEQQIKRWWGFSHHVGSDRGAVNQIIRSQEGKRTRHDVAAQIALLLHLGFDPVDKVVLQERREFPLIGKIRQRGKECRGLD